MIKHFLWLVFATYAALSQAQTSTLPLDAAKELLRTGQVREAYLLLEPLEAQYAGQIDFDYTFGVIAARTQEDTRAIFALERLLEINPQHLSGRTELARLYFKLGENTAAKNAFLAIQPLIPPQASQSIELYLRQLSQREKRPTEGWSGDVQLAYGRDDNINNATALSTITIFNAPFELSPNAQKTRDDFSAANAYARYRQSINARCTASGYAGFNAKIYGTQKSFNHQYWDFDASVACNPETRHQWVLGLTGQQFWVDTTMTRVSQGVIAQWNWQTPSNGQWSQSAQVLRINYPSIVERNARRVGLASTWSQSMGESQAYQVFAGAQWAYERTDDPVQNIAGYRNAGLKLGMTAAWNSKTTATAIWTGDQRKHLLADNYFLVVRNDIDRSLNLGLDYSLTKRSVIGFKWSQQINHSNIELYDYQKRQWMTHWRLNFN